MWVEVGEGQARELPPFVEGAFVLSRRDRVALQKPLEVREPEQHVFDAPLLDLLEHVLPRSRIRRRSVLALDLRHGSSSLDATESTVSARLPSWGWSSDLSGALPGSSRNGTRPSSRSRSHCSPRPA